VRTFRRRILDVSTTTLWTFRRQRCVNFVPCLISVTVILPLCNVCSNSITDVTTEKLNSTDGRRETQKDRFMEVLFNIQLLQRSA